MILHVTDEKYLSVFVSIYNSAIELFEESERGAATEDVFASQLKEDQNYIEIQENGDAAAFMSYHQYGEYYELTALYAKSEYQRKGVGQKLLHFFEQ